MKRYVLFPLLCLLLSAVAPQAQVPPPIQPGEPILDPTNPANRDPNANANPSRDPLDEMVTLNYPDTPVPAILLLYEQFSGKRLIKDATLAGANVSLNVAEQVTKREALSIIEATLLLNNFALVPAGENQLKIINIVAGKNPRSEGIRVYASPASLPPGDQIVTYYMPFKYLDVQEAYNAMTNSILVHSYGVIAPVQSAQALLITENASVIRQMLDIKELIDVPPAKMVSEFVSLMRADAERVADTITKMIEAQKGTTYPSGRAGGAPAANVPPPNPAQPLPNLPGQGSAESSANSLVSGNVQVIPDTRTNRILVIARPASFPYVKSLIRDFDRAVGFTDPLEVRLKYVTAAEVLPVLQDLLTEDTSEGSTGGAAPGATPGQPRNVSTGGNRRYSSDSGNGMGSNTSAAGARASDLLTDSENDTTPESVIVGKTRIIADKKANSILVIGPPESTERARSILSRLDQKTRQVYLSTVIGQFRLNDDNEFGIDYLQNFLGRDSGFASGNVTRGITTAPLRTLIDPSNLKTFSNIPIVAGLNIYGTIGDQLHVYLHALQSTNRFKVLSRPIVYASNNKRATISSGQRIAVPTQTLTNTTQNVDGTTNVTSNIDYEDVVLELAVIPLINADNEVTLKVVQTNDSVAGSQTIGGENVPTIATQTVDTTVTVANKHVVVLGGLVTESDTNNKSGIPVLSSIPYLGYLFKSTKKVKERNELMIFIQPNVVGTGNDILRASTEEAGRADISSDALEMAEPPIPRAQPVRTPIRAKALQK
ncbi:MAG TPA: secretin N-terminal domain-containing protein [Chthoniobacterales bacterium]